MPLLWDADATQAELYQRAGIDPDEPARMTALARGLGIRIEVLRLPSFPGDGALVRVRDEWRIYLRDGIPTQRKKWACAHELGEWALRKIVDEQVENAANAIAAALIAPRRAFAKAARGCGRTGFEALAETFDLTETAAALRSGEALHVDIAVVRPGLVRVRGTIKWPDAELIRGWARGTPPGGVTRHRLTDDARRVALVADEVAT